MSISDYILAVEPSWLTSFGIPTRSSTGFTIQFNTAAPAGAKLRYSALGVFPVTQATVDITEDALSATITFAAEISSPSGPRTVELINLMLAEAYDAQRRILRQERLDMVDLGGRQEAYTTTTLKAIQDLIDKLKDELAVLQAPRRPRIFRTASSNFKGL